MNITELQKQIQILTDQINDIFHATELNFDAIKIQLQIEPQNQNEKNVTSTKNALISQCQKQFKQLKSAYQQRSNLRLEYLINQQIKSQEEKVRRQRLLEYEDKIYDHRRLICDKQTFYDSLLKPKTKRPPGLTNEQFQDYRIKEAQQQERSNFQQLQEETQMLLKLEKVFRNHRILLEKQLQKYQNMKNQQNNIQNEKQSQTIYGNQKQQNENQQKNQVEKQQKNPKQIQKPSLSKQQQKQILQKLSDSIPVIYSQYDGAYTAPINLQTFQLGKQLLKQYIGIDENHQELMKDYKQEREMYRFLKWEKNDLVEKYKKLKEEIQYLREKSKIHQHKRKLSR